MEGNSNNQPRDPYWMRGLDGAQSAPRCGAKTRRGTVCQGPAMPNGRCKTHGGRSPGAPRGQRNGNWRNGFYSQEAQGHRGRLRELIKKMRATMDEVR